MLIFDFHAIGEKLYAIRKELGLTQVEVAERAGLSERTYADIERGTVNMRLETILRICEALHITPDVILTKEVSAPEETRQAILDRLASYPQNAQSTALKILSVYLDSLQ